MNCTLDTAQSMAPDREIVMAPSSREICDNLVDRDKYIEMCAIALAYAEYEVVKTTPDIRYPEGLKITLEILYHNNASTVFSGVQSYIEKVFLNSLALCFLRNYIPLLMVTGISDTSRYTDEVRALMPQIRDFADLCRDEGHEGIDLAKHLAKKVRNGDMTKEVRADLMRCLTTYEWLNLGNAYHLVVQANFPDMKIDGKSIRPDLFFWKPDDEDFKLVVECDGFAYHNNHKSFINDRRRDRLFDANGMRHQRFSGSEICNDPIGTANDLFKCLYRQSTV